MIWAVLKIVRTSFEKKSTHHVLRDHSKGKLLSFQTFTPMSELTSWQPINKHPLD